MSRYDLLGLQGKCKRDPEGYRDDVLMQLQHYNALHGLFMLKPGKDFKEFADLVGFLAQVAASYPKDIPMFHVGLIEMLEKHYALLDPNLRRSLVAALILLRNRGSVQATELLPLFFRLFRCADKQLRVMIFRHIVADIKSANKNKRDDRLNRAVQNFLQAALKDENESAAKKALSVITELYRRGIWTDARTVNLVVDACRHSSPKILIGALKFFLGQDEAAELAAAEGEGEDSDDDEAKKEKPKTGQGTAEGTATGVKQKDVYKAYQQGVSRSKNKKQAKLKRQIASIRKKNKREEGSGGDARFAAMQLINDPQGFAEHLFNRLQGGSALKFDTKMLLIQVLSRVVGLHRLHLLHLYPFLQRYVQPSQREVTRLLAAAATACHELVPPDVLEPLVRQLVNQFVHDRARPEVVAVGINTVREICLRCPLVMNTDLLQDLAQYKRARDKPVATAARALIGLFRELAPSMLEKKDRGKGADLELGVKAYGSFVAADRVDGAELLERDAARQRREAREAEEAAAEANSDDEEEDEDGEDESDDEDGMEMDSGDEEEDDEDDEEDDDDDDDIVIPKASSFTVPVLRSELQARGLDTKGLKPALVERMQAVFEEEAAEAAMAAAQARAMAAMAARKSGKSGGGKAVKAGKAGKADKSGKKRKRDEEEEEEDEDEEGDDDEDEDGEEDEGDEDEDEEEEDGDDSDDEEYQDEDEEVELDRDPITGRKRLRLDPMLTQEEKKARAAEAVAEAAAKGVPLPKVRKNGFLSLSELRRQHKALAKARKEADDAEEAEAEAAEAADMDAEGGPIEQERIFTPEDFRRIKAIRAAKQLAGVMDKNGAKKGGEQAADEIRAMLRRADKTGGYSVADRRVNPDTLAAVGLRKAHDKESRVASIMEGREDRVFGAASGRKQKKTGGSSNIEKRKKKNIPLAARVHKAFKRRTGGPSKAVADKQFKGHFRRGTTK